MPSGDVLAVYRNGAAHESTDSNFARQTMTAGAWAAENFAFYDPAIEVRDIGIATLSDGTVIVSFFTYDGTPGGYRSYTMRSADEGSTWDTPVDVGLGGFGAQIVVSAPVVELANGDLLLPVYGADTTSATIGYSRAIRSTDGGDTWSPLAVIANGAGVTEYVEPNICLLDNGDLLCMIRSDTPSFTCYRSTSSDDGATWSAPAAAFTGASGRPAVLQTPRGAVLCMYRAQTPDPTPGRTLYQASWDRGVTWHGPSVLLSAGGSYVYGQFVIMDTALVDGNVGVFFSNQYSDSNADNYWQLLADDARAPA